MIAGILALVCALGEPLPRQPLGPVLQYGRLVREERSGHRQIVYNRPCQFRRGMVLITAASDAPTKLAFAAVGQFRYTHAALVIAIDDQLKVLEADKRDGVRIVTIETFLATFVGKYKETIWVIDPGEISDEQSWAITSFAFAHRSDHYAPLTKLTHAAFTGHILEQPIKTVATAAVELRGWFCSELVTTALTRAGLVSRLNPAATTPRDIIIRGLGGRWSAPEQWQPAKFEVPKYLTPSLPVPISGTGWRRGFFYEKNPRATAPIIIMPTKLKA